MKMEAPLILVVDDQYGVRRLIQEVFRENGYRICLAANGQEAIALMKAELPALVLLDMKMPVMDGLETLRVLRRDHPTLRVLMMTALGEQDCTAEVVNAGACCCIAKPFDVFELRRIVAKLIAGEEKDDGCPLAGEDRRP